ASPYAVGPDSGPCPCCGRIKEARARAASCLRPGFALGVGLRRLLIQVIEVGVEGNFRVFPQGWHRAQHEFHAQREVEVAIVRSAEIVAENSGGGWEPGSRGRRPGEIRIISGSRVRSRGCRSREISIWSLERGLLIAVAVTRASFVTV